MSKSFSDIFSEISGITNWSKDMERSNDEINYDVNERRHEELVNQLTAINSNLEALTAAMLLQAKQLERLNDRIYAMYDSSTDSLRISKR